MFMSKKKRIVIYSITIFLFVLGFVSLILAIMLPAGNEKYSIIIGLSAFVWWGLALFILLKNYTNMMSSELEEADEKMRDEEDFFSMISIDETPQSLKERFIKSGFKPKQGFLHKWQFSFAKDYLNYYVAIAREKNIIEYFKVFGKEIEGLLNDRSRFHKNNVIYVFFFNCNITPEELDSIKNIMINQEIVQGLPGSFDTILPVVYDTVNQKYIVRTVRHRFSIALIYIALRKFYKMIGSAK